MGELSNPQVLTEGETPLCRCTNAVFLSQIYSSRSSAKPSSDQPARILRIPARRRQTRWFAGRLISRLPTAQSKIEARHRRCRSFALQSLRCVNGQKNVARLLSFLPTAINSAAAAEYRLSLSFRGGHSDRRRTGAAATGSGHCPHALQTLYHRKRCHISGFVLRGSGAGRRCNPFPRSGASPLRTRRSVDRGRAPA